MLFHPKFVKNHTIISQICDKQRSKTFNVGTNTHCGLNNVDNWFGSSTIIFLYLLGSNKVL